MSWAANMFLPRPPDRKDIQHNLLRILLVTSQSWGVVVRQKEAGQSLPRAGAHPVPPARSGARLALLNSATSRAVLGWAW
jgi:hypothetical protein